MTTKHQWIFTLSLSFILIFIFGYTKQDDFPVLRGLYMSQKPPGKTPEIFAPGIISTDESEGSSGFARNGMVFIFQRFIDRKCHTYIMSRQGDLWSKPELVPFWKQLIHNGDFVISPDDITMLDQVKQDHSGQLESNIWEVKLEEDGWGPRSALPAPINTIYDESFASRASNGNLYFFSRRPGGVGESDLYMAEYQTDGYSKPINLKELNTQFHEWDPYVAPDESFLIFCSTKPGGEGQDDLYISFRDSKNRWTTPVTMGKQINSQRSENRPYITNDGRFLFYTSSSRGNRDIYWVDAKIIEEIKPKELK